MISGQLDRMILEVSFNLGDSVIPYEKHCVDANQLQEQKASQCHEHHLIKQRAQQGASAGSKLTQLHLPSASPV